jgi:DNA (cytosine-5)-methyltransferase 1
MTTGLATKRALDLFCGAGGATKGLQRAGFHVTGVDIKAQPRYCGDAFIQGDALNPSVDLRAFDFIWASPPCQAYTLAQRLRLRGHPTLIGDTRTMLRDTGVPFCIENVVGAPLLRPILLCGQMFDLETYRHRLFECWFDVPQPWHEPHHAKQTKMGRPSKDGEFIQVVGNFSDVEKGRKAMGIDWMTRAELSEAIPPAYSAFIARAFLTQHHQAAA